MAPQARVHFTDMGVGGNAWISPPWDMGTGY